MAVARMRHEWDQTSILWSLIANIVRDPKKQRTPFCPSLIHPLRSADDFKEKPVKSDISVLKKLLATNGNGAGN